MTGITDKYDTGHAWFVAFAAFCVHFILVGLARTAGILCVDMMNNFHVNREIASAPFLIHTGMRNLFGPIVGLVGQRFSVRCITAVGGLIGGISTAACFFAKDTLTILILWGLISGVATAMTTTLPAFVIGQYFKKYRTTACGLAFSGGCVGAFIFPLMAVFWLDEYGLGGAFLIYGGIIFNTIPAAMFLRKPDWLKTRSRYHSNCNESACSSNDKLTPEDRYCLSEVLGKKEGYISQNYQSSVDMLVEQSGETNPVPTSEISLDIPVNKLYFNVPVCLDIESLYHSHASLDNTTIFSLSFQGKEYSEKCLISASDATKSESRFFQIQVLTWLDRFEAYCIENKASHTSSSFFENIHGLKQLRRKLNHSLKPQRVQYRTFDSDIPLNKVGTVEKPIINTNKDGSLYVNISLTRDLYEKDANQKLSTFFNLFKNVVKLHINPMFLLICLCRTFYFAIFTPVLTIIIDFSVDQGILEQHGRYLIPIVSVGELVGRLCFGWITDNGYLDMVSFMYICRLVLGILTASLPFIHSETYLYLLFFLFGLLNGTLFIRHPVLIQKYVPDDVQPTAMGFLNLLAGVLLLVSPKIIGYFRDEWGSYNGIFYIYGTLSFVVGILWIFASCILKQHGD